MRVTKNPNSVIRWVENRHYARLNPGTRATLHVLLSDPSPRGAVEVLTDAGLSTTTARRRLKKKRLPPPSAWRGLGRSLYVARQLQRSDAPLSEIAARCGYSDSSAIFHLMRRKFGLSVHQVRSRRGRARLLARWWQRQVGA